MELTKKGKNMDDEKFSVDSNDITSCYDGLKKQLRQLREKKVQFRAFNQDLDCVLDGITICCKTQSFLIFDGSDLEIRIYIQITRERYYVDFDFYYRGSFSDKLNYTHCSVRFENAPLTNEFLDKQTDIFLNSLKPWR